MTNPARKLVYIAHPLGAGPDRDENIANAERWVAWAAEFDDVAPVAPWVTTAKFWPETRREQGMAIQRSVIERCEETWLTGGRVSEGMRDEGVHARSLAREMGPCLVVDLTHLGRTPPEHSALVHKLVNDARAQAMVAANTMVIERAEIFRDAAPPHDLVDARAEAAPQHERAYRRALVNPMLPYQLQPIESVRSGLAAPPKPGEDVALPILTDDEGRLLPNPYIPAGRGADATYAEIPGHLCVLHVEKPEGTSYYVHTDPRMVARKREALIRDGLAPSDSCTAYLYDRLPEGTEATPGLALLLVLYPGRVDAFYFTFAAWGTAGSTFDTFNAKRKQIEDPAFHAATWHCPNARGVAYTRGEKLP